MANESFGSRAGAATRSGLKTGLDYAKRSPGEYLRYLRGQASGVPELARDLSREHGRLSKSIVDAGVEAGRDVAGEFVDIGSSLLDQPPETRRAVTEFVRGRGMERPAPAPREPEASPSWMDAAIRHRPWEEPAQETAPIPMRTTDPALRAKQDAADAKAAQAADAERVRQTYRAFKDPKTGVWNFSNQGGPGAVVLGADNASAGPDVGAAGRGGISSTDPGAEARAQYEGNMSEEAQADIAQQRYLKNMHEILARNPFAREMVLGDIQRRSQDAAIDRTYGQERAKSSAKLEALNQLDAEERQLMDMLKASATTPEQQAAAQQRVQDWRARQEVALGMRDRLDGV